MTARECDLHPQSSTVMLLFDICICKTTCVGDCGVFAALKTATLEIAVLLQPVEDLLED